LDDLLRPRLGDVFDRRRELKTLSALIFHKTCKILAHVRELVAGFMVALLTAVNVHRWDFRCSERPEA
jgi:hypothetical protein